MAIAKKRKKPVAKVSDAFQSKWREAEKKLAEHKREVKNKLAHAVHEAYVKGRSDEAKEHEKRSVLREKLLLNTLAKFEKQFQKSKPAAKKAKAKKPTVKPKTAKSAGSKKRSVKKTETAAHQ